MIRLKTWDGGLRWRVMVGSSRGVVGKFCYILWKWTTMYLWGANEALCLSPNVEQKLCMSLGANQVSPVLFPKAKTFASLIIPIPVAGRSGELQASMRSALWMWRIIRVREYPYVKPCWANNVEETRPEKHKLKVLFVRKKEIKSISHLKIHHFLRLWRSCTDATLSYAPIISSESKEAPLLSACHAAWICLHSISSAVSVDLAG